ncbi:hypothetical protein EFN46_10815 [Leuconostoc pseudomesenteroides]|uniref:hypothetical protein n=1 Tax=Leuconostoc pseudomesenteroides TaxID=33968 RepID=UPI0021A9D1EC|nr:hypothetical protein [Leuconostoc pseudomesenteroides]MCT4388685.1 hypothetical protein [Leuconostoc pseudomesenteroides]
MIGKLLEILFKIVITSLILSTFAFMAIFGYYALQFNDMTLQLIALFDVLIKTLAIYTVGGWLVIALVICLLSIWLNK